MRSLQSRLDADEGEIIYALWVKLTHYLAGTGLSLEQLKKDLPHHHKLGVEQTEYEADVKRIAAAIARAHEDLTFALL